MQEEAIRAGDVALGLLNEMLQAGIEPDVITYGCVSCLQSRRGVGGGGYLLPRARFQRVVIFVFFLCPYLWVQMASIAGSPSLDVAVPYSPDGVGVVPYFSRCG